jgi:D-alanine-D-alanine ligase
VDHLFLHKLTICPQLRDASRVAYDVYVNLCEGYPDWDVPSIEVIWFLEWLNLPYTGPPARLYDPPKSLMRQIANACGIDVPPGVEASCEEHVDKALRALRFPMFVKPAHAGDSLGIDEASLATCEGQLRRKSAEIVRNYRRAMIEEYISGREFTVLVAADPGHPSAPVTYTPIEFVFDERHPFKTYELKVETNHPHRNVPVKDPGVAERLRQAARRVFLGFEGEGYARLDFRIDQTGVIYFLDINFTCSVFYPEGSEGSADYILRNDPAGPAGFLRHIIREGTERHSRRQTSAESV